jgi:dipeptidyl aminopeptidase/acylaminoacyl peptidase
MEAMSYPLDRFLAHRSYAQPAFLPRTKDLVYLANTSGQFNVWRQSVPAAGRLGHEIQLTGLEDWSAKMQFPDPAGAEVLLFADKDGDENYQIFSVDPVGGWHIPLVHEPGVKHKYGRESYSPDGKYFAYSSNDRDPGEMDLAIFDRAKGQAKVLLTGGDYMVGSWAPDSRRLLVIDENGGDDNNLFLLDIKKRTSKLLSPHNDKSFFIPGPWDRSGKGFFIITNANREFKAIGHVDIGSIKTRLIETPEWDVEDVALSPNGRVLVWVVNENGSFTIYFKDLVRETPLRLPLKTSGVLYAGMYDPWEYAELMRFSADSKKLCFVLSTPTKPREVCYVDVGRDAPVRCTNGFVGNIPEKDMVNPEIISFPSFDRKIPAILYKPQLRKRAKVPAVIWMHGGLSQEQADYYGPYQYLLSRGICVLAPNIRGSGGYGKTYRRLMHGDWGGADLKDIESAAEYLLSLNWIDPGRIAISGLSLGGFHVLSAISRLPKYWKVAAEGCGPSDLVASITNIPEVYREYMKDWVGDPETQKDFLMERSPITYLDNVRCPLLVTQGGNDVFVRRSESDKVVERLKSRGVEVEYIVYPDEGHDFTKTKNLNSLRNAICEFLCKHLNS